MEEKKRRALLEELFNAALALDPNRRADFLDESCGADSDLRAEVQNLLLMHEKPGDFLNSPAYEGGLFKEPQASSLTGKSLGHYEILDCLGTGGMGKVYRARDTHLNRSVAIKVIHSEAMADLDKKRRFVQEARSASGLNHPGIVTIHDISQSEGVDFIAMEYIAGKTLNQMIPRKGLPISEVLKHAVQIADALAAAHAAGIVHRDLKPANVMVSETGLVKVLDFGLAKLTESAPADRSGTTQTLEPVTEEGTILGTVAYMSPEQAEGRKVDTRSDIFSFGSVLYEMITGRQAFQGKTKVSTMSAILSKEPDPLSADVPYDFEKVISRCLRKDPERRFQHMGDVKVALEELKEDSESGKLATVPLPAHSRPWILIALAILAILLAVSAVWYFFARSGQETNLASASFIQLTNQPGEEYYPSLSPDGRSLVYASRAAGNWDIYSQRVGGQKSVNLTQDSQEDDTQPCFAPDGDSIAFRSGREGGGIYVMGATGESAKRLTDMGYNPSWSPDGKEIVFGSHGFDIPSARGGFWSALWAVSVVTGEIRKITTGLGDAAQPSWSPHGNRIAFWSIRSKNPAISGQRDIWTVPAEGGEAIQVTNDPAVDWNPVWSPDGKYLYFSSDRGGSMNLWRVAIEEKSGRVLGQPEPLTTGGGAASRQHLSISRDGRSMAFVEKIAKSNIQRVPFDPSQETITGQPMWITQGSRLANLPDPSPDGSWVAFASLGAPQEDLFLIRPDGTGERQITNDLPRDRSPRWSPDGKRIMFFSNRVTDRWQIWVINPDGSGLKRLGETDQSVNLPIWSPDGTRVAYLAGGQADNFISELGKPWKDHSERLPDFSESESFSVRSWSPNGNWLGGVLFRMRSGTDNPDGIAVYSLETNRFEKLTNFGWAPVWLNDSNRLLFPYQDKIFIGDRGSKNVREIFRVGPYIIWPNSLRVSKDNRMIYYAHDHSEFPIIAWAAYDPKDKGACCNGNRLISQNDPPGQAPKSTTLKFMVQGNGLKQVFDGVDANGKAFHEEWVGKYDGVHEGADHGFGHGHHGPDRCGSSQGQPRFQDEGPAEQVVFGECGKDPVPFRADGKAVQRAGRNQDNRYRRRNSDYLVCDRFHDEIGYAGGPTRIDDCR
jgi:Tol biopolymer transport system component/predicted Ser/Thr protein kinase